MTTEPYSQIANEAHASIRLFAKLDDMLKDASQEFNHGLSREAILDEFARFNIWATNIKALQPHNKRSSLGARLSTAPKVARLVAENLKDLNNTLDDCERNSSKQAVAHFLTSFSVLNCVGSARKPHHLAKGRGAAIASRVR